MDHHLDNGSRLADHIQRAEIEGTRSADHAPSLRIEERGELDPGSIQQLADRGDPTLEKSDTALDRGGLDEASRRRTESPGEAKKRAAPVARGGSKDGSSGAAIEGN
jgi:hypothetical protein